MEREQSKNAAHMPGSSREDGTVSVSSADLQRLRYFLDAIPLPIFVKDANSRLLVLNKAMCSFMGLPHEQLVGRTAHEFVPKEKAILLQRTDREVIHTGATSEIEEKRKKNGDTRTLITRKSRAYLSDGTPVVVVCISDVTELKRSEDTWKILFNQIPLPMWVYDRESFQFLEVNRAAIDHYGYNREQFLSMTALDMRPREDADAFRAAIDRSKLSEYQASGVWRHLNANGSLLHVMPSSMRIDYNGRPAEIAAVYDITDLKRAEARIAHLRTHDPLTELPNRIGFTERLEMTIQKAAVEQSPFAVLCFNLDGFQAVNELYGLTVGDLVLQQVSRRLTAVAEGGFFARIGGDEFALIVRDGELPASAVTVAERMLAMMAAKMDLGSQSIRVRMSCGMTLFPGDGADAAKLIANANAAVVRAKKSGGGIFRAFEPAMDRRLRERRSLERDLWMAIDRNELQLFYQPQALISGEISGFEVLLRWHNHKRGRVSPDLFIPIAEESGLINLIGEWALRQACQEAVCWEKPLRVAVNVSPGQFRDGNLPLSVERVLRKTGLAPDRLELEITEGVLFEDLDHATEMMKRLKSLGVRIAMDDFGTGFSSLSYLQTFSFDKIKIDKSFVSQLGTNANSAAIIRAIIGLGLGLSMDITAEGVETADQVGFLRREQCPTLQGYLIGRPQPIEAYANHVRRTQRANWSK